jgi:hypothetical protein
MATDFDADLQSPDVDARSIVGFASGFLVFVAVSIVLLGVYYIHANVSAAPPSPRQFPEPRLEARSGQDLGALLKTQRDRFQSYAWVDRGRGLVRIPVSRAMAIVAAHGAKAYDPLEPFSPMPVGGAP